MTDMDRGSRNAPQVKDDPNHPRNTLNHWLALTHTPGLGCRRINQLLEQAVEPHQLFIKDSCAQQLLPLKIKVNLADLEGEAVKRDLAWLNQSDHHHILTLDDPSYPALLKTIGDAPPVLYVKGEPALLSLPQLAIVGSRNPTQGGHQLASDFAKYFCQSGLVVTSGLAAGIDGAAHTGALKAGGPTIAVIGTGPDRVYPARHRKLAHGVVEVGAIVTEFCPETPPVPANFPRRNRIISGLSLGTLVVEAAQRSGSLITARLAAEQGREVFAIPGSIHNPLARGCHALIRQGAKLVETAEDVIEELGALFQIHQQNLINPPIQGQTPQEAPAARLFDDPDYEKLFHALGYDPTTADELILRSGLTAEAVSSMLLLLELDGIVSPMPGGRYCRVANSNDT